jgi:hypothetical protein
MACRRHGAHGTDAWLQVAGGSAGQDRGTSKRFATRGSNAWWARCRWVLRRLGGVLGDPPGPATRGRHGSARPRAGTVGAPGADGPELRSSGAGSPLVLRLRPAGPAANPGLVLCSRARAPSPVALRVSPLRHGSDHRRDCYRRFRGHATRGTRQLGATRRSGSVTGGAGHTARLPRLGYTRSADDDQGAAGGRDASARIPAATTARAPLYPPTARRPDRPRRDTRR